MPDEKKNGRFHVGTALIILGIIGGPLAVWGESQLERGTTKEKLSQIERRQAEDRKNTRESLGEVREHVKIIDQNTQLILQELRAMQAVQREQQRRQR